MSGIALITKTDCKTVMIRLVHDGQVVDRYEVERVHFLPSEQELADNEAEYAKNLWEEK